MGAVDIEVSFYVIYQTCIEMVCSGPRVLFVDGGKMDAAFL